MIKAVHCWCTLWYNDYGGSMMLKKLKEKRYAESVTTREIASFLGISKPFYCQIENGKRRLSYSMAFKIASFFGVKPDYLFYDDICEIMNDKDCK